MMFGLRTKKKWSDCYTCGFPLRIDKDEKREFWICTDCLMSISEGELRKLVDSIEKYQVDLWVGSR